jgi:hypothetical protein
MKCAWRKVLTSASTATSTQPIIVHFLMVSEVISAFNFVVVLAR